MAFNCANIHYCFKSSISPLLNELGGLDKRVAFSVMAALLLKKANYRNERVNILWQNVLWLETIMKRGARFGSGRQASEQASGEQAFKPSGTGELCFTGVNKPDGVNAICKVAINTPVSLCPVALQPLRHKCHPPSASMWVGGCACVCVWGWGLREVGVEMRPARIKTCQRSVQQGTGIMWPLTQQSIRCV